MPFRIWFYGCLFWGLVVWVLLVGFFLDLILVVSSFVGCFGVYGGWFRFICGFID